MRKVGKQREREEEGEMGNKREREEEGEMGNKREMRVVSLNANSSWLVKPHKPSVYGK